MLYFLIRPKCYDFEHSTQLKFWIREQREATNLEKWRFPVLKISRYLPLPCGQDSDVISSIGVSRRTLPVLMSSVSLVVGSAGSRHHSGISGHVEPRQRYHSMKSVNGDITGWRADGKKWTRPHVIDISCYLPPLRYIGNFEDELAFVIACN